MNEQIAELLEMLKYRRPGGSPTEEAFIEKYLLPLGGERDKFGNVYVNVGESSKILWSSHTDTVHHNEGMQEILVKSDNRVVATNSNCLGADCTTGVWLMVNMIRGYIPGTYIFHRKEESGCQGSKFIATNFAEDLKEYNAAIAFDRYGYDSVITHQMFKRSCSEKFSASLAGAIDLAMKSDDGGVYTDTVSYTSLISECTNISVGYMHQHTERESQDIVFAAKLLEKMLQFDESKLVYARDPSVTEYASYGGYGGSYYDGGNWGHNSNGAWNNYRRPSRHNSIEYMDGSDDDNVEWIEQYYAEKRENDRSKVARMAELVRDYPEEAAQLLIDYGVDETDLIGTVVR